VFAFGVVLWELLTWELPWGTSNPWAIVAGVGSGGRPAIPAPHELPGPDSSAWPGLERYMALMGRCWHQNPLERPSFQEVVAELRELDPAASLSLAQ
jgi:hypothetical protein